jgi:ketosteroid isomerase-like protein
MEISEWARRLFATIDRMDAHAFASYLTEDGVFRFANQPAARGRVAVEAAVSGFFSTIAGLRHELLREWRQPDSVVVEGCVTYTRQDGGSVTVPFVDVLDLCNGAISDYRIYVDAAPVFASAA